jgi:2-polyprenyl-6-hydroxyphenyl methylase/3-demethylubiquinone-9 3-methyltransferase
VAIDTEITRGDRFAFGENWQRFNAQIADSTVARAREALTLRLGTEDLSGRTFIDVGCGGGLHSLAARQMGAVVRSFDFDPKSVCAAMALRDKHRPDDPAWTISEGDILDRQFVERLGRFDVVYSWGVLHHTGDLWAALHNTANLVGPGGTLWVALYNDQGAASRLWAGVKRRYNKSGRTARQLLAGGVWLRFEAQEVIVGALRSVVRWEPRDVDAARDRGMVQWTDIIDWVGGWPFQVSKPEDVLTALRSRGFVLDDLYTCAGGHGCNEFVFSRPQ